MFNLNVKKVSAAVFVMWVVPFVSHAETVSDLKSLIAYVRIIINSLIPVLIGIAVCVFFWGIIKYILAEGPEKLSEARNYIVMGIVAITVMLSVWGLAFLLKNTFFGDSPVPVTPYGTRTTTDRGTGDAGASCISNADCSIEYTCQNNICVQ
jgi:ABC-type Fe3+ transport system permease subunit